MSAVRFEIEELVDVGRVLGRLSQIDLFQLADMASEYMVNAAKARITEEQASPEGDPWDPWFPAYAATGTAIIRSWLAGDRKTCGAPSTTTPPA